MQRTLVASWERSGSGSDFDPPDLFAGRRSRTGTAGSSPVQRVSSSGKTASICAPRFWKRSAGP